MNIEKILQKIAIEREKKKLEGLRRIIILISVLLIGIFIGNFFVQDINLPLTGFAASGSLPTIGGSTNTWGTVLNNFLSQEHTSTGAHKNVTIQGSLDVNGNGNFTGDVNVTGNLTIFSNIVDSSGGIISIPSGFVGFFNTTTCPTGWNEMQEAVGRYFVAINTTGTLGATAGTALNDSEHRIVGNHTHGITDPTHQHALSGHANEGATGLASARSSSGQGQFPLQGAASTGITVNNTGNVSGTNAPYIQVLVCVKT